MTLHGLFGITDVLSKFPVQMSGGQNSASLSALQFDFLTPILFWQMSQLGHWIQRQRGCLWKNCARSITVADAQF